MLDSRDLDVGWIGKAGSLKESIDASGTNCIHSRDRGGHLEIIRLCFFL